jgi:hypothetical protein
MSEAESDAHGKDNKVQLGCGTLILIALIVLIFSGGGRAKQLEGEIQDLKTEVIQLREAIAAHTAFHQTNPPPREQEGSAIDQIP